MHIALVATLARPRAVEIAREVLAFLQARQAHVRMGPRLARAIGCAGCETPEERLMVGAQIAIAIGGDGTMLGAVRSAAPHGVPVLGVNAGALGFLTEVTPDQVPDLLPLVLRGEHTVERRMMLHAKIYRDADVLAEATALNDVVVRQGRSGRLVQLDVWVAGHQLGHFGADGLIVSSPTGSTAYGLAAGGPIVHPAASALTLVPICPHSLAFRPMVIPATDPVSIHCEGNAHGDEMLVSADGLEPVTVSAGDRVIIHPAPEAAQLVKLGHFSFYDRLREKLQWGG
jgi:NAD+ kinase